MPTSKINYSANDRAIVAVLKNAQEPMTLAQINAELDTPVVPAHITHALTCGLIAKDGEVEVYRPSHRKVSTYNFVTADILMNGDKAFNYTDNERAILAVACNIKNPFTLAQLAEAMGVEKLSSGSINGLVKKGNFTKGDQVEVETQSKSKVGTYVFVKDIPEAE